VTPQPDAADAVLIRLGDSRFAVGMADVAEVGRLPAVTRLPGVPGWLAGVVNWRGRLLPAVDLRALLGAESAPWTRDARLVVLATDTVSVGLLVDGVDGTTSVGDELAPFPAALDACGLVRGQLPRPNGPVAVLDVDAVVRLRESLPRARRSA
jgi:chemotaxis signal transduction protein